MTDNDKLRKEIREEIEEEMRLMTCYDVAKLIPGMDQHLTDDKYIREKFYRFRINKKNPLKYTKIGKEYFYRKEDVKEWFKPKE